MCLIDPTFRLMTFKLFCSATWQKECEKRLPWGEGGKNESPWESSQLTQCFSTLFFISSLKFLCKHRYK